MLNINNIQDIRENFIQKDMFLIKKERFFHKSVGRLIAIAFYMTNPPFL
jgi:hypothetical protein